MYTFLYFLPKIRHDLLYLPRIALGKLCLKVLNAVYSYDRFYLRVLDRKLRDDSLHFIVVPQGILRVLPPLPRVLVPSKRSLGIQNIIAVNPEKQL